jgi:hypothetical protein
MLHIGFTHNNSSFTVHSYHYVLNIEKYFTTNVQTEMQYRSRYRGLDDQGVRVRVPAGSRIFTFSYCSDRPWSPPSLLSNVYRGGSFPGVKYRQVDHPPPTSAKVKRTWIYTSPPPPICIHGMVLK